MMKIDEDFGADDLRDETRYRPNSNTISKALGYFYILYSVLTSMYRRVIPTLKLTKGEKAAKFCSESHFGTWVGKTYSAITKRFVTTVQPMGRLCC
jgi:hypothetical protein